ncbi:MAG: hypothetical protein J6T71_00155 [Paludibacteraceae bacterium]|nr:hypothetical protein [Paludibacteraceae bacterium]
MNYTSTYRGSGRSGIYYSAPVRSTAMGNSVMAQAPVAAMGSTGVSMGRGIASTSKTAAAPQVRGIYTSASNIVGGVTSAETYASFGAPRKLPSGHAGECSHGIDEDDDGYCDRCGMDIYECDEETCWCPLDLKRAVMLFFALLAAAYAVYKKRTSTLR